MPNINVELLRGRSIAQRREFAEEVTAQAVRILKARPQDVRIVFTEIGADEVANGGVLAVDDASRAEVLALHSAGADDH
ncbi:MAG: tautomerase family protein [Actinomycetes bacterium]